MLFNFLMSLVTFFSLRSGGYMWQRLLSSIVVPSQSISLLPSFHANDCQKVTIICLGLSLNPDGSMKTSLLNRCDKVIEVVNELAKSGCAHCNVILSGGDVVKCGQNEATCMLTYLKSPLNISEPESRMIYDTYLNSMTIKVIVEKEATNTLENFMYCRPLLENLCLLSKSAGKIIIVTSDYHVPRALLYAKLVLQDQFGLLCGVGGVSQQSKNDKSNAKHRNGTLVSIRELKDRPRSFEEWYMQEILEIELLGIRRVNFLAEKYRLPLLNTEDSIDAAIHEVTKLSNAFLNDGEKIIE